MPHRNATQHTALFGFYSYTRYDPASHPFCSVSNRRAGLLSNMKPLKSETQDLNALQELGRASVQIVHDLKNQLNGLKLYATFLRKRMEKAERPQDEQETVAKLIAGLERAASDMTTLVRLGRPMDLRRQPQTDLVKILKGVEETEGVRVEAGAEELAGDFDVAAITEAFKTITSSALALGPADDAAGLSISLAAGADGRSATVEWRGVKAVNGDDPFHSFAGSDGLRMTLAARIIEAHGGATGFDAHTLRAELPLEQSS
jgi:signal transduction histidine kinase